MCAFTIGVYMTLWYNVNVEKGPPYKTAPTKEEGENTLAVSKAQQQSVHKYIKKTYDRVELLVKKGQKEIIKAHAAQHGESVNAFVARAIDETMERDAEKEGTETE